VTTENLNLLIGVGQLLLALLVFLNIDKEYVKTRIPSIRIRSAAIYLLIIGGFAFAGYGVYLANKLPKERIVEKPIDRVVEKLVPQECPKTVNKETATPKKPVVKPEPLSRSASSPLPTQNCPNGICNGGNNIGSQSVYNFAPPAANLSFTEEVVAQDVEKSANIHIKTDKAIPGAVVGVIFSGPFKVTDKQEPRITNSSMSQVAWGTLVKTGTSIPIPNSIFVRVNMPAAFGPNEEVIIPITAAPNVHVEKIGVIN